MKKNIKLLILSFIILFVLIFSGCTNNSAEKSLINSDNNKDLILTNFYPTYDITKNIVGDNFDIAVLIPIGVDPHSFQLSPREIVKYSNAKIFITMGGMFSIQENKFINSNNNNKMVIIDSTKNLNYSNYYNFTKLSNENINDVNPHIWLSFDFMIEMTKTITNGLIKKYPNKKEEIEKGEFRYLNKLEELKLDYKKGLSNCKYNKIIVNHEAYSYLSKDYNFSQITISGFSPQSEPSPNALKKVIDTAKRFGLKYVFVEANLDKKTSETITNDIGGKVLELNPIISSKNESYFDLMENNLKNLKLGLACK